MPAKDFGHYMYIGSQKSEVQYAYQSPFPIFPKDFSTLFSCPPTPFKTPLHLLTPSLRLHNPPPDLRPQRISSYNPAPSRLSTIPGPDSRRTSHHPCPILVPVLIPIYRNSRPSTRTGRYSCRCNRTATHPSGFSPSLRLIINRLAISIHPVGPLLSLPETKTFGAKTNAECAHRLYIYETRARCFVLFCFVTPAHFLHHRIAVTEREKGRRKEFMSCFDSIGNLVSRAMIQRRQSAAASRMYGMPHIARSVYDQQCCSVRVV